MYVVYSWYGTGLENKTKNSKLIAFVIQTWLVECGSKNIENHYVKYHFCNKVISVMCFEKFGGRWGDKLGQSMYVS